MKIFISMSMNGRPDSEIREDMNRRFEFIKSELIEHGMLSETEPVSLIDTINHINVPANPSRLWYLGSSIQKLNEADLVYFADDWYKASGCWTELAAAVMYDKNFTYDYPNRNVARDVSDFIEILKMYKSIGGVTKEKNHESNSTT